MKANLVVEFLIFLVVSVHAKFNSLESNSAILFRHNQIVLSYYDTVSFCKLFLFIIVTGFKRFRESGE